MSEALTFGEQMAVAAIFKPEMVAQYAINLAAAAEAHPLQSEVENRFGEGLYIRCTSFAKGTQGLTMIHRWDHPFFILTGDVEVGSETEGFTRYTGPCMGMTKGGTQRVLRALDDTVWVTVHPNPDNCRDVEAIVARITIPYVNEEIPEHLRDMWRHNQKEVEE